MNCAFACNIRKDCNVFRMEGESCIFGETFWSFVDSDSGLEAFVEHNRKKKNNKTYGTTVSLHYCIPHCLRFLN